MRCSAKHDVLIIGAGSAGAILAARLSEDPARLVTLVEAGPDYPDKEAMPDDVKFGFGTTSGIVSVSHDWHYEADLTSRCLNSHLPRGRLVGGCSAVNAQIFLRGEKEDFDGWQNQGAHGWSFSDVLPYFKKLETDLDFPNVEYHGYGGPIPVCRYQRDSWTIDQQAFFTACREFGFPECSDHNAPATTGVGALPLNNTNGIRWSTALTYLREARSRKNLMILAETRVHKIVFEGTRVVGAEATTTEGPTVISARHVFLCAGAIGTPHLLMLSGIGPSNSLNRVGIPVISDLPEVGMHLQDHPTVEINWQLDAKFKVALDKHSHQVALRYTAPGSDLRNDMIIYAAIDPTERRFYMRPTLNLASSRGRVLIASADANVPPRLEFALFSSRNDLSKMREAIRLAKSLAGHSAFRSFLIDPDNTNLPRLDNNDVIDEWILTNATTGHHVAGTCRMGQRGVVDSNCRVRGIENLWVVDASIMPVIVRANINACVMMMAEVVADRIRKLGSFENNTMISPGSKS
jgi:choline dehydrogenase